MELVTLLVILLSVCCSVLIYQKWRDISSKPLPPGPRGLGTFFNFVNAVSNFTLHVHADRWARQYGDIVSVALFGQNIVILNEGRLMKRFFCDDSLKMVTNDRPSSFASRFVFKDQCIGVSSLGKHHTRMRKLFHSSLKLYGDGVQCFEDTIIEELRRVVLQINSNAEVPLDEIISNFLLNAIHILLTDERPNDGDSTLRQMKEYNSAVNRLFGLEVDQPLTIMPFLRYLPGPLKTKCDNVKSCIEALYASIYENMKAQYIPGEPRGLIQAALETQHNMSDKSKMADDHIRFIMLEIISAGYLTTRGTLLGLFLALMEQPDLQDTLYEHIKASVGDRKVNVVDRGSIPYVDAMVLEVLRYLTHGPVSLPHRTNKDMEIDSYRIPKDSIILANFWSMAHDEKVWDSPWVFRPERFLDDQGHLLPPDHPVRQRFLPFGVGKRQCPGEVFAKTRMFLLITTLCQHFKFLPPEGGMTSSSDVRTWSPGLILQPEKVLCKVELRDTRPLLQ
ncbi:cytochrome P450 2U1-like isoform X1 [Haliotis rufescens]|uniref:cytochrome P450 2U1-like isoform X1 n=1 Tax=Haliotis rufescens TaxID=6454 RepID=UPI001EB042B3|nr:cytochrome P450 2U1-like isoform X1 [Haliotis rufescens]